MSKEEKTVENATFGDTWLFSSMRLGDILTAIKKFRRICVAFVLIFGAFGFYKGYVKFVPSYASSVTFAVSTQKPSATDNGISVYSFYYDTSAASQLSAAFPYILKSNLLHDKIKNDLDIQDIPVSLTASSVSGSNMFTITAKGTDPQLTYDILMSAVKNYPSVAKCILGNIKLTVITEPVIPAKPENSSEYKKETLNGMLVGLAVWTAVILLYAAKRNTVRASDDIKNRLGGCVVGALPRINFKKHKNKSDKRLLLTNRGIGEEFTEAMCLMKNTFLHCVNDECKTVAVTSTAPNEGKTTAAINLALSLSMTGKKILLIEGNLKNPDILKHLYADDIMLEFKRDNFSRIARLDKFGLSYMELIKKDEKPWEYINCEKLAYILSCVRDEYDFIIIDTPPCGLFSDASLIAQVTDSVLYVILHDTVRIPKIKSSIDGLISNGAVITGCILNGTTSGFFG